MPKTAACLREHSPQSARTCARSSGGQSGGFLIPVSRRFESSRAHHFSVLGFRSYDVTLKTGDRKKEVEPTSKVHQSYMAEALSEARKAVAVGEIPIGAVVVKDGCVIGRGHNLRETANDPTAHAEIVAIREASRALGTWRLEGCTMYVTVEPCAMCAGAIVLARIPTLVLGTRDPKAGACGSLMNIVQDERLNHRVSVVEGILAEECQVILKEFFSRLRRGVGAVERARLESE